LPNSFIAMEILLSCLGIIKKGLRPFFDGHFPAVRPH